MNAANSGRFTKINAWGDFFQGDAFVRTGSGAHIVMCHDIVRTGPGNIMAFTTRLPGGAPDKWIRATVANII